MSPQTKEKLTKMKESAFSVLSRLFGAGNISMMRVLTFFVVVDIVGVWTISCVKNGWVIQDIPTGVLGVFTSIVLAKAGQRFAENGGEKKSEDKE